MIEYQKGDMVELKSGGVGLILKMEKKEIVLLMKGKEGKKYIKAIDIKRKLNLEN